MAEEAEDRMVAGVAAAMVEEELVSRGTPSVVVGSGSVVIAMVLLLQYY